MSRPSRATSRVPSERAPAASIASGVRRQNTLSSRPEKIPTTDHMVWLCALKDIHGAQAKCRIVRSGDSGRTCEIKPADTE